MCQYCCNFYSAKYCDQLQMTNLILAMVIFSYLIYVSSNEIFECLLLMVVGIISHLSWFKQWGDGILFIHVYQFLR